MTRASDGFGSWLAFGRRSVWRAALWFFGSMVVATGLGLLLSLMDPEAVAVGGLGIARFLMGWKIELAERIPVWLVVMGNNLLSAAVVLFVGPLGCALELRLRAVSPWYRTLSRAMSRRRRTAFGVFDGRLNDMPAGGAREGMSIVVLVPSLATLTNGAMFGIVAVASALTPQMGFRGFLLATAPHGIIELTAIVLAAAVAFEHVEVLFGEAGDEEALAKATARRVSEPAVFRSAALVAGLLVVAAVVEGQLTPAIYDRFAGS